ncbi:MAG: IPT/TIG domain-containing protein, partial [Acidobacteria bacterium]|nr:IPT/TIG domain-containing protein [Acidobacteriota bacterium]
MKTVPPWLPGSESRLECLSAALLLLVAATAHPGLMAQSSTPAISELKPDSGRVGNNVQIKGSNFGTTEGTVTFNGTGADIDSWEDGKIKTSVPEGATTGPVVVTVGTQSSAGVTFTVTETPTGPTIDKLEPDSGPVGTEVKIKGLNFGETQGSVTFNGVSASSIAGWNDKKVRAVVPSTATTGSVVVTTSGGVASSGVTFTVTLGTPSISKLEPDSGAVGTSVKIKGSNFGSSGGSVTFNGTTATTSNWSHDVIRARVPVGATTGNVVVTNSANKSSSGTTFTVTPPAPVISSLDPSSGLVGAGVTIEGSNFGSSTGTVTFNGTSASTSSWATGEIETTVPSGATSGNVVVTTSGGQASAGVAFTVTVPDPAISRLDPTSGPVDTEVRIHGTHFGSQAGSVTFNGTTASPDHWADQMIRARVPEGATSGSVVVTTSGGKSSAGVEFTVTAPPAGPIISRLDPDSGRVDAQVTIHGSNFGTSGTVTFNGTSASTSSWDTDEIQTTVPAGAATGVVIVTVDGKSSAGVTFTVIPPAPVISRLDPDSGPVDTEVTIHGSNFGSSGTVTFNGTTTSTSSWASDEIETSVPSGATTGLVVVTVGNQSSAGATFTVTVPPPVISRLDPDSGPVDTEVRIHGTNFGSQTGSVTFNGETASLDHWEDRMIRVRVPEEATDGPVVVTTSAGTSSAGVDFTVTPPPTGPIISRLDPDTGPVDTQVTIHGSNFGSSGTVTFNGTTASVTRWADNRIQTRVPEGATTGPVVVTAGTQASAGVTFTVTTPIISRLDPDSGPVDTQVTIHGSNFGILGTVTFNGTTASVTSWGNIRIRTR